MLKELARRRVAEIFMRTLGKNDKERTKRNVRARLKERRSNQYESLHRKATSFLSLIKISLLIRKLLNFLDIYL